MCEPTTLAIASLALTGAGIGASALQAQKSMQLGESLEARRCELESCLGAARPRDEPPQRKAAKRRRAREHERECRQPRPNAAVRCRRC